MPGRAYSLEEVRQPAPPIVLPWPEFCEMFFQNHSAGEHVAIVGPTGSGKTVLGLNLCKIVGQRKAKDGRPARVVVLNSKPRDDTVYTVLPKEGWPTIKKWPPAYGQEHVVVWPRPRSASGAARQQRNVFLPLLDEVYKEGGQTVYIPEAADFERPVTQGGMGMAGTMSKFWADARSNKLTVISDTQRPRAVTRLMWSEPSWLMIYEPEDTEDLKRVAELTGRQKIRIWQVVPRLGPHEFACVRRQRGSEKELYVSRVDMNA